MQQVADDMVSEYLRRGYDITSAGGTVIEKAVPSDVENLRKLYTDQQAVIARLERKLKKNGQDLGDAELEIKYQELVKTHEDLQLAHEALEEENADLKDQLNALNAQLTALMTAQ